jgi:hypothetical protein
VPGRKLVHDDPFGVANQARTEHFVLYWGDETLIEPHDATDLLAVFEGAWADEIDRMGYPAPASTDRYYFPVYVCNSGGGTPSCLGTAGYFNVDLTGFPYIAVNPNAVVLPDAAGAPLARHEFFHAIQASTGRFAYEGLGAWYFEATAEWASARGAPASPDAGEAVGGYTLLPQLPLNYFDYPDGAPELQELHQYGAFLFPMDLSESFGIELVRDSWTEPGREPDPIEVLRTLLADGGEDLNEVWLDHIAHNAVFDYPDGEDYAAESRRYEALWDGMRIADTAPRHGGSGVVTGASAPYRYGAAQILLEQPADGILQVRVAGRPYGTEGSKANYGARIVRDFGDRIAYVPVPFDGWEGAVEFHTGKEDAIWLVVGAWTPDASRWESEQFPFQWSLEIVDPPEDAATTPAADPPEDDADGPVAVAEAVPAEPGAPGCSCDSGGSPLAVAWFAGILGVRRRRSVA